MTASMLPRYAEALRRLGSAGLESPELEIGTEGRYSLRYIPFEHVNVHARLVIVGITPGNTQLKLAYERAQELLCAGVALDYISSEVMKAAAFGGSMRTNLLRMLRHFEVGEILGIAEESNLWDANAELLHSTSVVPFAAFRSGRMFNGAFDEILRSRLLRRCFEDYFVASLRLIRRDALYIALGPTPLGALDWCAERNVISPGQVVGAFAHPSGSAGSQVPYFLREVTLGELNPRNPVRARAAWLDAAYERVRRMTQQRIQQLQAAG